MEISTIQEIIIAAAPAITAIIGIIASLVAAVKRIKQASRDTLEECRKQNAAVVENVAQIARNNEELRQENEELKRDLRRMVAKLDHVHIIDDK